MAKNTTPIYKVTEGEIPSCPTTLRDGLHIARTDLFGGSEILYVYSKEKASALYLSEQVERLNAEHHDSSDSYWLLHAKKGTLRSALYGATISPNHRIDARARVWFGCTVLATDHMRGEALPDHVELCTIMATDAPRLGERMGTALYSLNTFVYTPYYDDGDVSCAIRTNEGIRALRSLSSESLGDVIAHYRRRIMEGQTPHVDIAWMSESSTGWIEIEQGIRGIMEWGGDPHTTWVTTPRGIEFDPHIEAEWKRLYQAVKAI